MPSAVCLPETDKCQFPAASSSPAQSDHFHDSPHPFSQCSGTGPGNRRAAHSRWQTPWVQLLQVTCALGSSNTCSYSSLVPSPSPVRLDSSLRTKRNPCIKFSQEFLLNLFETLGFCSPVGPPLAEALACETITQQHLSRDCHCPASTSVGITAQSKSVAQVHTGRQRQSRTQNSGSVTLSIVCFKTQY